MWLLMLSLAVFYAQGRSFPVHFTLFSLFVGALAGLAYTVLALLVVNWGLRQPAFLGGTVVRLFGNLDQLNLFYRLVFVLAPVEELFFRSFIQREAGIVASALMGPLIYLVYFLPSGTSLPLVLLVIALGALALYLECAAVYHFHGLPASLACHAVALVALFQGPLALQALGLRL